MGTKIDYTAMLTPMIIIGEMESVSVEERLEKIMQAMKEIVKEAKN